MAPTDINAKRSVSTKPAATQYYKRRGPASPVIIKIVHIHAPKLVCTDVANFRALVQEMTGNFNSIHRHEQTEYHGRGNKDNDDDDDVRKIPATTSADSSTCESVRVQAAHEHCHFLSSSRRSSPRSSVDDFFANLHDEHDHNGGDDDSGGEEDRQEAADRRCRYNLNCSAYLPQLTWRPETPHDIPGGFDYFSF
ncbi:hypothetical protein L7F22_051117 [Adiantum nelumboides]|nr:hypothetical protein [Adiantum nelumboides]